MLVESNLRRSGWLMSHCLEAWDKAEAWWWKGMVQENCSLVAVWKVGWGKPPSFSNWAPLTKILFRYKLTFVIRCSD